MMIGTKLVKGQYTDEEYMEMAEWCDENNCTIEDKGDYYEVVELTAEDLAEEPSLEERISFLEEAVNSILGVDE